MSVGIDSSMWLDGGCRSFNDLPTKCGRLRARINEVAVLKFILLDCFWKLWAWIVPSTCSIPIKESSGESHEELRRNVVVSNSIGVTPWYDMNRSFGSWLWKRSSWIFFVWPVISFPMTSSGCLIVFFDESPPWISPESNAYQAR